MVKDAAGTQYILSNNHVLARSNLAQIDEAINQPGQIDQNCGQSGDVAYLSDFIQIKFKKRGATPPNKADAAIAEIIDGQVRSDGSILDVGVLSSNTVPAFVGQTVQKSGRTSGHTFGTVSAVDVTVNVGYSQECGGASNQTARFVEQIRIVSGDFSTSGDSGSLIVEAGTEDPVDGLPRAVGLLFAGSSSSTLASPIDALLSLFNVTMVGGAIVPPGPTGSVSGLVTDADDASPIAGATVTADTGQSDTTDANGTYSIEDVPVGNRTITASSPGFDSNSLAATVSENLNSEVNFALLAASVPTRSIVECIVYDTEGGKNSDKHLLITIRVADDIGNPVGNAQVNIAVTLGGQSYGTGSGITNGEGELIFSAKNARSGEYVTTVTNIINAGLTFDGSTLVNSFDKGTDVVPTTFCLSGSSGSSGVSTSSPAPIINLGRARDAKARHSKALLAIPSVVGHGVSLSKAGQPVIEIYLEQENATARARIPAVLDNVPVRVVVTGPFEAF